MGQVIGIGNTHIRAIEGAEIPTLKVSGTVGVDFRGSDLADAVSMYSKEFGEVRLILDSFGGSASDAFSFYDSVLIEEVKLHVDGRGTIASAASIIMAAAGRKRSRLYPNAEYLAHNASGDDDEAVERANVKMQTIYMGLTGMSRPEIKALMAKDKMMSAQEAKRMGFVGAIVDHMKLAAHADNTQPMADEKVKRVFIVDRKDAAAAAFTGEIEIMVDKADAALKTELDSAVLDLKAEREKSKDLQASVDGHAAAIAAAVKKAEDALKAEHVTALEAGGKANEALKAEIAELKKTPAASAVKPAGTKDVVDAPDANAPLAERYPKLTAQEREADLNAMIAKKRSERLKAQKA